MEVQEEHLWKEELEADDDNRDDLVLSLIVSGDCLSGISGKYK